MRTLIILFLIIIMNSGCSAPTKLNYNDGEVLTPKFKMAKKTSIKPHKKKIQHKKPIYIFRKP